jgi:DNA-binding MarR family transcriptional regulator
MDTMSTPRWLNDEEMRAWRGLITTNRLLFEQLGRELARESGLSMADYEVLVQLSEAEGRRMRMTELAFSSLSSKSRLSHQVGRMEEAGWVRRESCPSDRRGAFAVLTDAGFAVLAAAAPGHVESVRRHLFDHLTADEVQQLAEITGKLSARLDQVVKRDSTAPHRDGLVERVGSGRP